MSQGEKHQSDKTKNQLMESMRKSKSAGATPGGSAAPSTKPSPSPAAKRERGHAVAEATKDDYSMGGLRWPD